VRSGTSSTLTVINLWVLKVNPRFITCDYSVPQPRHFCDLALTDYYRFLQLKEQEGWRFASSDDLRQLQWQCWRDHNERPAGLLPKVVLLLAKVHNGQREVLQIWCTAGLPIARSAEFVALFLGLVDHTLYIGPCWWTRVCNWIAALINVTFNSVISSSVSYYHMFYGIAVEFCLLGNCFVCKNLLYFQFLNQ